VQRTRRLVERLAGRQHDRFAVVKSEDHAAADHVRARAGRVPVSAARVAGRLVLDADGIDHEPVGDGKSSSGATLSPVSEWGNLAVWRVDTRGHTFAPADGDTV
jgi:hypothetical protein